jgi:hypothetical protein
MIECSIVNGMAVEGNGHAQAQQIQQQRIATPSYEEAGVLYDIPTGHQGEGYRSSPKMTVSASELALDGAILGTARNNGLPVQHLSDVKDTTVVKVGKMELSAKDAASAGFLQRDSQGNYSEANSSPKR